jgi:hypothetical protein
MYVPCDFRGKLGGTKSRRRGKGKGDTVFPNPIRVDPSARWKGRDGARARGLDRVVRDVRLKGRERRWRDGSWKVGNSRCKGWGRGRSNRIDLQFKKTRLRSVIYRLQQDGEGTQGFTGTDVVESTSSQSEGLFLFPLFL